MYPLKKEHLPLFQEQHVWHGQCRITLGNIKLTTLEKLHLHLLLNLNLNFLTGLQPHVAINLF